MVDLNQITGRYYSPYPDGEKVDPLLRESMEKMSLQLRQEIQKLWSALETQNPTNDLGLNNLGGGQYIANHGLNTKNIVIQVVDAAGAVIIPENIEIIDVNRIKIKLNEAKRIRVTICRGISFR